MKSGSIGKNILAAEISNVSPHGIWLLVEEREYFLPYDQYPWFKEAKLAELFDLQLLHGNHLHWPKLDIDLELDSIKRPEDYPLIYK